MMANKLTKGRFTLPPHLRLLGRKLADVAFGRSPRLIVEMPPRHAKSWLDSWWFPVWYLSLFPHHSVMLGSYEATFAAKWGRWVRNSIIEHSDTLGVKISSDSGAQDQWETDQGGGMKTAGVGGPFTGHGGNLLLIDDPIKNSEEANSQVIRDKTWEWWCSTARTRLEPGGGIAITMCMVGDTSVLMADGSEVMLKDIRPGDSIATYDNGCISVSQVRNWKNQGCDDVFEIQMKSGRMVKANARHPFLVETDRGLRWIRLRNLGVGDRVTIVQNGDRCGEPYVLPMDAVNQLSVSDTAPPTTSSFAGHPASYLLQQTLSTGGLVASGIDTASQKPTTTLASSPKGVCVLFADSPPVKTYDHTGAVSSASTTTTKPGRFGDSFATTAISPLGTERLRSSCSRPLDTFESTLDQITRISPAGREDVFDIEVDRTENFIANGLVSHNTRWHEDDLVGRILAGMDAEETGDSTPWEVLRLPAVAEENDPLGRQPGQALWPARFDEKALRAIQLDVGDYVWASLFQQDPPCLAGNAIYNNFSAEAWPKGNIDEKIQLASNIPIHLSVDFNRVPGMHGIVGQHFPLEDCLTAYHEIHSPGMTIIGMVAEFAKCIKERWGGWRWPVVEVYGDATGRITSMKDGKSMWDAVEGELRAHGIPFKLMVPLANPGQVDRVNTFNSALKTPDNRRRYKVRASSCPRIINDFKRLRWDGNEISKRDKNVSHSSDADGYRCFRLMPLRQMSMTGAPTLVAG